MHEDRQAVLANYSPSRPVDSKTWNYIKKSIQPLQGWVQKEHTLRSNYQSIQVNSTGPDSAEHQEQFHGGSLWIKLQNESFRRRYHPNEAVSNQPLVIISIGTLQQTFRQNQVRRLPFHCHDSPGKVQGTCIYAYPDSPWNPLRKNRPGKPYVTL